jgi:hypothetical protein
MQVSFSFTLQPKADEDKSEGTGVSDVSGRCGKNSL